MVNRFPSKCLRSLLASAALLTCSFVGAQDAPDFDLEARLGDVTIEGGMATMDGEIVLVTSDNDGGEGAQGWSLSVAGAGSSVITNATSAGTIGAETGDGGLRNTGFEKTELTSGDGNSGAVSAIVLSFTMPITADATGEAVLLNLSLEAAMPAKGCIEVGIELRDGLQGSGQPVDNKITWKGKTRRDDGGRALDPQGNPFDNDSDGLGSASRVLGENCGELFNRGDCDSNGDMNLTDAIFALIHLFQGGPAPVCAKACDVTDDGGFNLTDPINLLNHLFLGGPAPAAPSGACGVDLTEDELECVAQATCA